MEAEDVVRAEGERTLEHLPDDGIALDGRGALVVGERVNVEHQGLLDLGVVEQGSVALGGDLRVIGQHDGRAEHRVVIRCGQDWKHVYALVWGLQRRDEAAVGDLHDDVG